MQRLKRSLSSVSNASTESNSSSKVGNTKKLKNTLVQSNTLLNYFESNKRVENRKSDEVKSENNTILNYFKFENKISDETKQKTAAVTKCDPTVVSDIEIKSEKVDITQTVSTKKEILNDSTKSKQEETTSSLSSSFKIGKNEVEFKKPINNDNDYFDESEMVGGSTNKPNRKCPFYKRIEGTQIVVDAFSYGDIENCNAYFLSHYHYDHFIGLNKYFKNNIYCSQITANLVERQIKVEKKYIKPLELNKFFNLYDNDNSVQVALIDANHCPGSVMFLYKLNKLRKYVLHTGDFRASDELIANSIFNSIKIDVIHLDTTYLDSYYTFLPQSKIISLGVETVRKELEKNPKTLIVCGSYTIGKERIFLAIAESLEIKVHVTREKKNVLDCLNDTKLDKILTLNPNDTNLHVVKMAMLNIKDLDNYLSKHNQYEQIIAIKPSGWTHSSKASNGISIEKRSKNILIYGLEYSEHSSFEELKKCITTLRPKKIIPTVNVARKEIRDKMQSYFNQWLEKTNLDK